MFKGEFFDGVTAAAHTVTVDLDAQGLTVSSSVGQTFARWTYADLSAEAPPTAREARLGCKGQGTATLVVRDAGFAGAILQAAPHLQRAGNKVGGGLGMLVGWGAAIVVAGLAIYFGIGLLAGVLAGLVPLELEREWGDAYAAGLTREAGGLCDEDAGQLALDTLVGRLDAISDTPHPLDVKVLRSPMVNAFALPGGHVVIFSGLIKKADSADEVAGVLAHEIGHVAGRHSLRGLIQQVGIAGALTLVFGGGTWVDEGLMTQLVGLSYSRDLELEADRYAADLLARADIRRDGLVRFFARLDEIGGDAPLAILSTHPASDERVRLLANENGGGPAMSAADWGALKAICGDSGE